MNETRSKPGRMSPRIAALLAFLAVFAIGVVAGFALDRTLVRKHVHARRLAGRDRLPIWWRSEQDHRRYWRRMHDRLGLTPDQRVAMDSLLARRARQLEAARAQVEPRMLEIMAQTRRQIDSLLTPGQRERLEDLRRRRGRDRRR